MTYLLRLVLVLFLPAFALAAIIGGICLGAWRMAAYWGEMWREA